MTLVSQMTAPEPSSGPAELPSVPWISPFTRFAADQALARLIRVAPLRLSTRSTFDSRSIRCGFSTVISTKTRPSSIGSSHVGRNSTSRPGSGPCSKIATVMARTTCQRGSPRVFRRHAGTKLADLRDHAPVSATARPAPARTCGRATAGCLRALRGARPTDRGRPGRARRPLAGPAGPGEEAGGPGACCGPGRPSAPLRPCSLLSAIPPVWPVSAPAAFRAPRDPRPIRAGRGPDGPPRPACTTWPSRPTPAKTVRMGLRPTPAKTDLRAGLADITWTEAERAKGQAWGLKTIESFHTHGTPPVA